MGLGDPLVEIVHIEFQSSASARKHADLLLYNALLYAHHLVPVHTMIVLLRPGAAHPNMGGALHYAARPGRGKMDFGYEVVRLWELPAEELLNGDLAVVPLAVLGRLPEGETLEEGLAAVAKRVVERLIQEAPLDRAKRLLTDALLLTGLRVKREVAAEIFRGVRMMQESDTYLMILDEGKEKQAKKSILWFGEERFGPAGKTVYDQLDNITDLERLERMTRRAATAASWQDILDTP
ncbi:MAG TPA: hypothetical protein VFW87_21335 [Pirellulales bacterium]|nr:hypothetical protein [Pirellulales bacterium]